MKTSRLQLIAGLILALWAISSTTSIAGWQPPTLRPEAVSAVQLDDEYLVYLPLVQRPTPPPPWVDTQSREASRVFYLAEYQVPGVDTGWTGNHAACGVGTTTEAFRASILQRINYFRSMAGIPPLRGLDDTYNVKAQAAALLMSANRNLDHYPDSSWTCYTEDGREGAGSSNLYLGVYGPSAISGYIRDPGSGNYFVGHRRWILYPQTQVMGTGDIPPHDSYPAANALWVFDQDNMGSIRPQTREAYVAWPPPGYVPYQVVTFRWSFAYPKADFSQATVTMTRAGEPLAAQINTPVNGYGENTLVWEPQMTFGTPPAGDTLYSVTVSNVVIDSQPHTFTYNIIVFDPAY